MSEIDQLLGHIEDWTEELLLRGTAQFAPEDARLLERLAGNARRLGMEVLEQLLLGVAQAGERDRLTAAAPMEKGEHERSELFFRLSAYVQLARDRGDTAYDEESQLELEDGEEHG